MKDINSIKKVEETFGIKFPSDYKNIVLENNAATPSPNTVDKSRQTGKAFGELLNFNLDENENIVFLYQELKNKIQEGVFPITMDPGGNFYAMILEKTKLTQKLLDGIMNKNLLLKIKN